MESVSVTNTHFAFDLFKKIRGSNKTNNVVYSPLSISSALAMVSLGAAGNTEAQMSEADLAEVFNKTNAIKLPPSRAYNCDLVSDQIPPKSRVFPLTQGEDQAMEEYIKEALAQDYDDLKTAIHTTTGY
ncbi:hypothetical protein NFI96_015450 [Prochilodus magdalenae]|nr:hypothetical protein NFI96_015450 [Prochilodus magdalenae]